MRVRFVLLAVLGLASVQARGACDVVTAQSVGTVCGDGSVGLCVPQITPFEVACDTSEEAASYCLSHQDSGRPAEYLAGECVASSATRAPSYVLRWYTYAGGYDVAGYAIGAPESAPEPDYYLLAPECGEPPSCADGDPVQCSIALEAHETRCAVMGVGQAVTGDVDCEAELQCTASPVDCAQLAAMKRLRCGLADSSAEQARQLQVISDYMRESVSQGQRANAVLAAGMTDIVDALAPLAGCDEPPCEPDPADPSLVAAIDQMSDTVRDAVDRVGVRVTAAEQQATAESELLRGDLANALADGGTPTLPDGDPSEAWASGDVFSGFDMAGFGFARECPMPLEIMGEPWPAGVRDAWCGVGSGIALLFVALCALWCLGVVVRG